MKQTTLHLPPDGSIPALLKLAARAIETGDKSWLIATEHHRTAAKHYRTAAEHLAKAQHKGASQRLIAKSVGKSAAWVNRLLSWRNAGYRDETPFGPESKAKRQRASVQAAERTSKTKKSRTGKHDELAAAMARAKAAEAEAARARAEAERVTEDAMRTKAEAARERIEAEKIHAEARRADPIWSRRVGLIDSGIRNLLVKALGMLGSDQAGERASAGLVAERQRAKLGMTWDELIVKSNGNDANRIADEDLDEGDADDGGYEGPIDGYEGPVA